MKPFSEKNDDYKVVKRVVSKDINFAALPLADDQVTHPGRRILTEEAGYGHLGFAFPEWKKWLILTSIFVVQISMNFNAAIYGNAVPGLKEEFGISASTAKLGQMVFLVAYAFGCELWAPWSEELGRFWVLQGSLFLVNIWQIPSALASGFWMLFGMRLLGGLSNAGGSVTLGIVADLYEPADQQYAIAFVVFSSVAGSVVAPIFGGFITQYATWEWVFWTSLIFGVIAQAIHASVVTETRSSVLLERVAAKLRTENGWNIVTKEGQKGSLRKRLNFKHSFVLMWRPYHFLLFEPIVGFLSLLSGFSDALIFTGLDSFPKVFDKWGFSPSMIGLAFTALLIGYIIAYIWYLFDYSRQRKAMYNRVLRLRDASKIAPERRLRLICLIALKLPFGLIGWGFASLGPPVPWVVPLIFAVMIGIANFAIYMATIDYMVAAYGPFSASATGGNGFCRDFLAGMAALYTDKFYDHFAVGTKWQLVIPSLILAGIAAVLCIPVFAIWYWGEKMREKSKYANQLAQERAAAKDARDAVRSKPNSPSQSRAASPERENVRMTKKD